MKPNLPWKPARALDLPWDQPDGLYDNDGPKADTVLTVEGHEFAVKPTGERAFNTSRMRYRVECLTCSELIHAGSTSATAQIRFHLDRSQRAEP